MLVLFARTSAFEIMIRVMMDDGDILRSSC